MTVTDQHVELRAVASRELAFEPPPDSGAPPPVASAKAAVPLLWLALFDYAETEVRRRDSADVLAAVTPVAQASARAAALLQALPSEQRILVDAARAMQRGLERAPADHQLALFPVNAFAGLRPNAARAYLAQLVGFCDLWEQLRKGKAWNQVRPPLERLCPDIVSVLGHNDPRIAVYYLVGSLVDLQPGIADFLVRDGQGEKDVEPEALAVGEQGLLLGRFAGAWKLMSSATSHDLHGVWSEGSGAPAFCVGQHGTITRVRKGRCTTMESPTEAHLRAVWGLGPKYVCAVGEGGTLVAFNGKAWQPWPVPTQAPLHAIGGGPDNIWVAAQDLSLLRFDGRSWTRTSSPDATMFSQILADEEGVCAVGGGQRGGVLYRLERAGWARDDRLPRVEWLEGMWRGWGLTGVAPETGPVLVDSGAGWISEAVPVERLVTVAAGTLPMAVGVLGRHHLVLARTEKGWQTECAVLDLKINCIWVAGRPKPARIKTDGAQPSPS